MAETAMIRLPRFYPILDLTALARGGGGCGLVPAAAAMLEGGARILELRVKGEHFSRERFGEAGEIAALCRQAGARLLIDDRADIALLLEDAGLHVGQDDLPPAAARRLLGPARLLGFSTHNAAQLAAGDAEPVDYLAIGPVFATASKQRPDPAIGVERLREMRPLTKKPLVAIGGITLSTARELLGAGADSLAVIGGVLERPSSGPAIRARVEEWIALVAG